MRSFVAALLTLAVVAPAARAGELPVLGQETKRGGGTTQALAPVAPGAIAVDGAIGDWLGAGPGYAGTVVRSRGELIYTDHLFDAYGPDDGRDAQRLGALAPLHTAVPSLYRLDAIAQNDPAGQFGLPMPEELQIRKEHGDLGLQDKADLTELRVGAAGDDVFLLARTTTMATTGDAALLVLLDTAPGTTDRAVGFGSGLRSAKAELAVLLAGDRGWVADLASGEVTALPAGSVATRPEGYDNAIEARLDRAALGLGGRVGIAAATGRQSAAGDALANVANVAFRTAEPVRERFDRQQALALHAGSIDEFFAPADLAALAAGANERWIPAPGYHERIFRSDDAISTESGTQGVAQHYGVYLPAGWTETGRPSPLQLWLHWRGGDAHSAGNVIPSLFTDLGDARGTIVISPAGRGTSTWYVGKGHADVIEAWQDAHSALRIDTTRRYVTGHSMGGWGSFLFTILHPDWFAAALPASPPVTQGAWTGLDFEGCEQFEAGEYSPCFSGANGGDARVQHTLRLLENVRHVPWAMFHGTFDELVPTGGVARQHARLLELGYRNRLYLFHTQEHFGPPLWDQWREGADYMHRFASTPSPARVTFIRDMPFERATERELDFDFDTAYWLSGLEPADEQIGVASFDGRSLAIPEQPVMAIPEVGGPVGLGQTGPWTMTGLRWAPKLLALTPKPANAFEATLRGARAATLDLAAMRLDASRRITATVTTDTQLTLTLLGARPGTGTLSLAPGTHRLAIG